MSDFRLSSLSGRRSPLVSAQTDGQEEIVQSGYLNRKCIHEPGGKKSKDRSWITLWCTLRGTVMEFYRVEGISPKPNNQPPPKEMFPPPSLKQSKFGFVDVENGAVNIDYTSQMHKDLQKRRQYLFQLELVNNTEYIFQAPADKNRTAWVVALKQASRNLPHDEADTSPVVHSLTPLTIKSSRDSIKQKSRQNVHSVKKQHTTVPMSMHGTMGSIDESELLEVPVAQSLAGGDPNLKLLKKRLQAKKELLKQLKTMYTSFMGGAGAMYAEALVHNESPSPEHIAEKEGVVHRRMSLPESKGQEDWEDKRSSTGDYCVSITTPLSPGIQSVEGVLETELLVDYYLVPGAKWSLLKKGEVVRVLGRASNGWYQCTARRNHTVNMEFDATGGGGYMPLFSNHSGAASDLSINTVSSLDSITEPEVSTSGSEFNVSGSEVNIALATRGKRNSSGAILQSDVLKVQKTSSSLSDLSDQREDELSNKNVSFSPSKIPSNLKPQVGRTQSYLLATEEAEDQFEDVITKKQPSPRSGRRKAATVGRSTSAITPSTHSNVRLRQNWNTDRHKKRSESASLYVSNNRPPSPQPWRLVALLEKEKKMGKYEAPLIGCVAPSALKCFAESDGSEGLSSSGDPQPNGVLRNSSSLSGEIERPESGELVPELQFLNPEATELVRDSEEPASPGVVVEFEVVELERPVSSESVPESSDTEPVSPKEETLQQNMEPPSPKEEVTQRVEAELLEAQPLLSPAGPPDDSNIATENISCNKESNPIQGEELLLVEYKNEPRTSVSPVPKIREGRAKSLPPPTINHTPSSSPVRNGIVGKAVKNALTPTSVNGKRGSLDASISSESKSSRFKNFFKRKKTPKPGTSAAQTSEVDVTHSLSPLTTAIISPAHKKRPHTISRKPKTLALKDVADDFDTSERRLRVSSMSGRPVRREGVGLVIGGDSSSDSEDENEEEETSSMLEDTADLDEPSSTPQSLDGKQPLSRQLSDTMATSNVRASGMRRSASDHDSLALKANLQNDVIDEQLEEMQPKTTQSLKRGLLHSFRKPRSSSENITSPTRKPKKKRRGVSEVYKLSDAVSPGTPETNTKWDVIFRAPPRGEKRFVYLDPAEGTGGKYGFRLQSYGRIREQGKVLQTFVQSVMPGSVSFLAGLYPGDAIIEVNGVDVKYVPVEDVVKAIQEGGQKMERIALKVEFVDGVTRLDGMKKADDIKAKIKERQAQLKKLIDESQNHTTPLSPPHSPRPLTPVATLVPWGETTPTSKPRSRPFQYNKQLNNIVAEYQESVVSLQCDVLVMPLSSCHQPSSGTENVLLHLLKTGGEGLLDELSLAKQCRVGENIITGGHDLPANSIYHCVFGNLEESLQKCCVQALSDASSRGHRSIVFWLDGFASLSVSPQIIIESVRQWLSGNNSVLFDKVVFAAKANLNIIENFLEDAFPLEPFAQRDSVISEQESTVSLELGNGNETPENGNESPETQNMESEKQNETSKLKEEIEACEKSKDVIESDPLLTDADQSPPLLPLSPEEIRESKDTFGDLPEISVNPPRPPLLEKTSVSDIGFQLELNSDDELDKDTIELKLSDSDSEGDMSSLLKSLSDDLESIREQISVMGGSPQMSRSSLIGTSHLSKSVPTRGLVMVMDHSPSPSPSASPRLGNKSPLVLNPDRQESDV